MTAGAYKPRPATAARIENAEWLLDVVGEHPARVAERIGMSVDAMSRMFHRAGKGRQDIENERTYRNRQKRATK